jgi:hypothetical protein
MQKVGCPVLKMRDPGSTPRSIAVELALLFLGELESQIEQDPERLVSTEAVLSFAAVRRGDPPTWQRWRRILEKYDKSNLIDFMLNEPVRLDVGGGVSAGESLITLVIESGIDFFHDANQHGWASVRINGHWENHPIRSRQFQLFLLRTYYRETATNPGAQAIRAALGLFEAKALFDGEEAPVNLRIGAHRGKLYLDLCDPAWRAVEIDATGWRIVDRSPARFQRPRGSQSLPEPQRGGSLEELRPFLNVDHRGWTLIRAFLVTALRPGLPYPILVAKGEQGAGKSTACRVISSLVDPRTSALRGLPREVRDLTAAARNSWLVCFDNLSYLSDELADAACRLATGGGFGGRELYSDHDEAVFDATRPLVFNSIPDLGTTRPDFLDRALIVDFLDIRPEMRRDETKFWRGFEEARPRVLGALLDAVVAGLGSLPDVTLEQLPRMADFALWVNACEEGLGIKPGEALVTYQSNRAESHSLALDSSPLYEPVAELAREGFRGSVGELLERLNCMISASMRHSMRWPKAPNVLSNALRRMTANLRAVGIEIQFSRADVRGRHVVSVFRALESGKDRQ